MQCVRSFLLLCFIATTAVAAEPHWSLQPMKCAVVSGESHPIDFFIVQKLREKKLTFSAEADRVTLLRRVTLDLTGLPPSPAEVRAFARDARPTDEAFMEVVDRLLASPRHGERWAQHWQTQKCVC